MVSTNSNAPKGLNIAAPESGSGKTLVALGLIAVLRHASPLLWSTELAGNEFHYSSASAHNLPPLFEAQDKNVMVSYAYVIDVKSGEAP